MTPPLSDTLRICSAGRLHVLSAGGLYHPVARLRLEKCHPARAEYIKFTIYA